MRAAPWCTPRKLPQRGTDLGPTCRRLGGALRSDSWYLEQPGGLHLVNDDNGIGICGSGQFVCPPPGVAACLVLQRPSTGGACTLAVARSYRPPALPISTTRCQRPAELVMWLSVGPT